MENNSVKRNTVAALGVMAAALVFALLFAARVVHAEPAGIRCNINFGIAPTVTTGDNGCLYNGEERVGGVPDGWYVDVYAPGNKVFGFAVICASVLTLRPIDGSPVPILDGPIPQAASEPCRPQPTVASSCPTNVVDVARVFLGREDWVSAWTQYFRVLNEPGGNAWTYNTPFVPWAPILTLTVPNNWKIDHPGGSGLGPGSTATAQIFTLRCGK